ncbi:MAG: HlyD family efflux transporter periplasmic adaptor subunit [Saprospirales bacterium]|nr:HlyD family efflux transporter periplasmic adaptor subunit [Saprospirales bacterium]
MTISTKKLYTIEATTDGAVQELQGLQNGNYVFSNQRIATLSPDSTIIATCFVSSKDIGLIKINQRVFLQIDAYNYREWNTAKAQVIEISEDAVADDKNKSTYFIVKCKLLNNQLKLKNGYVGKIKKGMTFNARFLSHREIYMNYYLII